MSAIAGIVHFDGAPIAPGLVEKMTGAMLGRGPDGVAHWSGGAAALGQCMLRTTPESLEETQPLANEDASLVLVMDGRVDNGEDLRRDLLVRGAVLRDRSDAELVLRAYEAWGEACPDRIIGEYVFFIWDARQRRLFGARDAAGSRHFYYHAGSGWFAFASDINGLLALERIERRLNESRLLDYLAVEYDRDDEVGTFYRDIQRLPAGHAMEVTGRGVRTWRHWEPGNLPADQYASLDECAEAFLDQLRVAVKCRLRSTGPVGAMLSGGLDSSSIVGLIRKEFRSELQQPLKTFSLVREDRENCSDWRNIRAMLEEGWVEPHIIDSTAARSACQAYLGRVPELNEPFSHGGFNHSLLYGAARAAGCRVVFDGMAADLLFYGPERSIDGALDGRMFAQIPAILTAYRRHYLGAGIRPLARAILAKVAPEIWSGTYRRLRHWRAATGFRLKEMPGYNVRRMHRDVAYQFLASRSAQRVRDEKRLESGNDQQAHASHFSSGLLSFTYELNGQIALSQGVEPRSPFSDRRMMEFAIRMPVEAKLFAGWYKHLLRKSAAGILPESVRWRREFGQHPGWRFHEQLVRETARHAPDFWNLRHLAGTLGRWIDAASLVRARGRYESSADYASGYNLLALAVLSRWMAARNLAPPGA